MEPTPPNITSSREGSPVSQPGSTAEPGGGQFNQSEVQAVELPLRLPHQPLNQAPTLYRRVSTYLLSLGHPQSILSRLLTQGMDTDQAFIAAAGTGNLDQLSVFRAHLSNPDTAIKQAALCAIENGQLEILKELGQIAMTPLESGHILEQAKLLAKKEELTETDLTKMACLFPYLPVDQRVPLLQINTQFSSVKSLNKIIYLYRAFEEIPEDLQIVINKKLDAIKAALALYNKSAFGMCETTEFLLRTQQWKLLHHFFQHFSHPAAFLPEAFLLNQATPYQLFHFLSAIKQGLMKDTIPVIKNPEIFLTLRNRFPDSLTLKVIISSIYSLNLERTPSFYKETFYQCMNAKRFNEATLVSRHSPFELIKEFCLIQYNSNSLAPNFYCFIFRYLPFSIIEDMLENVLKDSCKITNNACELSRQSTIINCYLSSLHRDSKPKAHIRCLSILLENQNYPLIDKIPPPWLHENPRLFELSHAQLQHLLAVNVSSWVYSYAECLLDSTMALIEVPRLLSTVWPINPIFVASVMLTTTSHGYAIASREDFRPEFIKQLQGMVQVEKLLAHLPGECIEILRTIPGFQRIPCDLNLLEDGNVAACYANMDSAWQLLKRHWGKGVACALLFVNNMYPKFAVGAQESLPEFFPMHYNSSTPDSELEKLFDWHIKIFVKQ